MHRFVIKKELSAWSFRKKTIKVTFHQYLVIALLEVYRSGLNLTFNFAIVTRHDQHNLLSIEKVSFWNKL